MIIPDGLFVCPSAPIRKGHHGVRWSEPTHGHLRPPFHRAGLVHPVVASRLTKDTVRLHNMLRVSMGGDTHA